MSDFVVVHRTFDPIEVEIVVDILVQNGIDARGLGTRHGAIIGVGQGILEQRVEVPASRADEAREILAAFLASRAPAAAVPATPAKAAESAERPRRSAVLAAGAVLVVFGGGHFYARRGWSGLVLGLAQLAAIVTIVTAADLGFVAMRAAGLFVFALLAVDLVGAQRAVRAWNRGESRTAARQIGSTLAVVAVVALGCAAISARLPPPPPPEDDRPPFDLRVPADPGPDLTGLDGWPLFAAGRAADGGVDVGSPFGLPVGPVEPAPTVIDDPARARELARAIAADIHHFNEQDVVRARTGPMPAVLQEEIDQGRELFQQRTSPSILDRDAIYDAAIREVTVGSAR